jgi:hypothetical protein
VCACVLEGGRVEGELSSVVGGVKELRAVRIAPQHSSNGSKTLSHTRTWSMREREKEEIRGTRKKRKRRKERKTRRKGG